MALVRMNPALAHFSLAMSLKILSWLPVKALLRFRCVCKSWKSLMLDLSFVKLHLQRSYCRDTPVLFTLLNSNSKEEQCSLHYYCSMQRLLDNPLSAIDDGDLPFNQKLVASKSEFGLVLYNRRENRVKPNGMFSKTVILESTQYVESLVLPYRI
ncbi:hypothetical protein JHK82_035966 [Glycine max]|nr:hypothetical protein JHK85_036699 [Glycine max]KAG4976680.1 hypothetical protein JHK86_036154 [Glycine max]KAG5112697.1 hypothetical protein JHK82_035966 [Glycine max]KAG5129976.1 hypothetical protein JHK84_036373 [Glycine max]